jgi:molybdopterin converting factor small subunit
MPAFARNLVVLCAYVGNGNVTEPVQVRVRLSAGLAELFRAPFLTVDLADGATVADLYARLEDTKPDAAAALRSAVAVVAGEHAGRGDPLRHRQVVALLLPISGG